MWIHMYCIILPYNCKLFLLFLCLLSLLIFAQRISISFDRKIMRLSHLLLSSQRMIRRLSLRDQACSRCFHTFLVRRIHLVGVLLIHRSAFVRLISMKCEIIAIRLSSRCSETGLSVIILSESKLHGCGNFWLWNSVSIHSISLSRVIMDPLRRVSHEMTSLRISGNNYLPLLASMLTFLILR